MRYLIITGVILTGLIALVYFFKPIPVSVTNPVQQETKIVNTFFNNICGNTGQSATSQPLNVDGYATMVLFIDTNKEGAERPDFRVQASFDGQDWLTQRESNEAFFLFPVPVPIVAPWYRVQLQANATGTCVTVHEYLMPFFVSTGV